MLCIEKKKKKKKGAMIARNGLVEALYVSYLHVQSLASIPDFTFGASG